jgi:uncharacterized protein (TIGR03435 family)
MPSGTIAAQTPFPARHIRFEVVSIHPTRPDEQHGFENWTPSGFSAVNADLWGIILQAYFGERRVGRNAVSGYPGWVTGQRWDIEAKVAPEDIAEYQKYQPRMDDPPEALGWSLIRSLLAERFHLVVHRVPAQVDGYALVLAKTGPRMKLSPPEEPQPAGAYPNHGGYIELSSDGLRQNYYYFTMQALATYLAYWMNISVVDQTGLTGHYDFTLKWRSSGDENEHPGSIPVNDPDPPSHYDFGALGLRVEHTKIPIDNVVVDHVERPSEN